MHCTYEKRNFSFNLYVRKASLLALEHNIDGIQVSETNEYISNSMAQRSQKHGNGNNVLFKTEKC